MVTTKFQIPCQRKLRKHYPLVIMQCHQNQLKTTNLEFVTFVGNRLENTAIMVGRSAQAAEPFSEDQCKASKYLSKLWELSDGRCFWRYWQNKIIFALNYRQWQDNKKKYWLMLLPGAVRTAQPKIFEKFAKVLKCLSCLTTYLGYRILIASKVYCYALKYVAKYIAIKL